MTLTRKAPMTRGRFRSRPKAERGAYARRERHVDYMLWVKTEVCSMLSMPGHECWGPIEADHAHPEHGRGQKCHDAYTIPICKRGHEQKTAYPGIGCGPFEGWERGRFHGWLLEKIVLTQRRARAKGVAVPVVPPDKVPWRRDR